MAQEAGDVAPWGYDLGIDESRWTRQLYRQLGYDPTELVPSLSAFLARVHPDDHARFADIRDQERKAEPGSQFQTELRLLRGDGTLSWIDRRSRVIEHEGRRRIIGVNVDITARKKHEDDLHFIMGELSDRTKNLLSVVQAMASQTARHSGNFAAFRGALPGPHPRLVAIARPPGQRELERRAAARPDPGAVDAVRRG